MPLNRGSAALVAEVANAGELSERVRERLFAPFAGHAGHDRKGLGLGLYIVERFVQAHGGSVSSRSTGGDTAFTLRIPRGS